MNKVRRNEIKQIVLNALKRFNCFRLPVPIKQLTRSYENIRLIPYSHHMKKYNLTYKQTVAILQTEDAVTDYKVKLDIYIICYNDINHNIVNSYRYRWNIAHELGHVLLNHHKNNNKTKIFRNSLTDIEYNQLEEEADYFASLILVPYAALIAFKINDKHTLQQYCHISSAAAGRRLYDYINWKENINPEDEYDKSLFHYYYNFIFKKKCTTCKASLIQRYGKHCPICGQTTLYRGDGKMLYKKLSNYRDEKLKICPTCENEETDITGNRCHICGTFLVNFCSDIECNQKLPVNARYCVTCGSISIFSQLHILESWEEEYNEAKKEVFELEAGLPFN